MTTTTSTTELTISNPGSSLSLLDVDSVTPGETLQATTGLNVRARPSSGPDSSIIGVLDVGDRVKVVYGGSGWALVECRADWVKAGPVERRGFVSLKFLEPVPSGDIRYVRATTLNVRSRPVVADGNKVGALRIGAPVRVVDIEGDWSEIKFGSSNGYVASAYLRDPVRDNVERLVRTAYREWERFDFGAGKEWNQPFVGYVQDFWEVVGRPDLDGNDRGWPWSAAFISALIDTGGLAYDDFKKSASHHTYINDSIRDRGDGRDASFWGYRLHEKRPEIGDLIATWRISPTTYDTAPKKGAYSSHTDLVIDVRDNTAYCIGGNVSNSVTLKTWPLNSNGYFTTARQAFALMKNRTS